jgi:hypothetical protein
MPLRPGMGDKAGPQVVCRSMETMTDIFGVFYVRGLEMRHTSRRGLECYWEANRCRFEDHVWFEDQWMVASLCDE